MWRLACPSTGVGSEEGKEQERHGPGVGEPTSVGDNPREYYLRVVLGGALSAAR